MDEIKPIMVWPLASYLAEEMELRGWTCIDVAKRMPGDYDVNVGVINLLLTVTDDENLLLDRESAEAIAEAFGFSADLVIKLDTSWRRYPEARQPFECPEHLLSGLVFPTNDNASAKSKEADHE